MSDALFELLSRVGRRSTRAGHARARPLLGAGSRDPQRSARRASSGGISLFHDRDADAELGITSREAKEPDRGGQVCVIACHPLQPLSAVAGYINRTEGWWASVTEWRSCSGELVAEPAMQVGSEGAPVRVFSSGSSRESGASIFGLERLNPSPPLSWI